MTKFNFLLLLCCCCGALQAQQFVERVYLKDSVTVYEGFIVAQAPAQYVRIYRFREKDTLHVDMGAIWKITKEYATRFERSIQPSVFPNRYYKSVFLEVFGRAGIYSVNFDMRTTRGRRNGWGINAGLGILASTLKSGVALVVPFGLNYLVGQKKGFLELGAGATYMAVLRDYTLTNYNDWGVLGVSLGQPIGGMFGNFTVGYRHMPLTKKGLTWRIAFTPVIYEGYFEPFGGIGIGYQFW
jgi:hypothetical protein